MAKSKPAVKKAITPAAGAIWGVGTFYSHNRKSVLDEAKYQAEDGRNPIITEYAPVRKFRTSINIEEIK